MCADMHASTEYSTEEEIVNALHEIGPGVEVTLDIMDGQRKQQNTVVETTASGHLDLEEVEPPETPLLIKKDSATLHRVESDGRIEVNGREITNLWVWDDDE